jgi:hypothetical protein
MNESKPCGRRVKVFRLSIYDVMDVLLPDKAPQFIERLRVPGLPDGYEVLAVSTDWMRMCILVNVYHPSFPVVPDGEEAPLEPGWDAERVVLARVEGESGPLVYREVR